MSVSLTNMGMLATLRGDLSLALSRFEEAQRLAEEVGDPWVVGVGHHNLGNANRDVGDLAAARGHYCPALATYAEHDDRWSLAHLFEDIALLLLTGGRTQDAQAVTLLSAAEAMREEIGAPRFSTTREAIEAAVRPAQERTASDALVAAAEAGRSARLEATVLAASRLLTA